MIDVLFHFCKSVHVVNCWNWFPEHRIKTGSSHKPILPGVRSREIISPEFLYRGVKGRNTKHTAFGIFAEAVIKSSRTGDPNCMEFTGKY